AIHRLHRLQELAQHYCPAYRRRYSCSDIHARVLRCDRKCEPIRFWHLCRPLHGKVLYRWHDTYWRLTMKTLAHIALILTAAIAKAQYTYRQFDVSDLVLIGTVTHVEELSHVGWIGRRDGSEHNEQAHFFRFTIRVSRILKGACPSEFDCVCPSGLAYISQRIPAS